VKQPYPITNINDDDISDALLKHLEQDSSEMIMEQVDMAESPELLTKSDLDFKDNNNVAKAGLDGSMDLQIEDYNS